MGGWCLFLGVGCLLGGSAPGGCLLPGGVSQHALRQTGCASVNRMTDRCKNITFANFVFGR